MFAEIRRLEQSEEGTLGVLLIEGRIFCYTLERPWMMNERNISCIPTGMYVCKRYHSQNHPNTFEVTDVHNRSYILFHVANTINDLQGCIGLGEEVGYLMGQRAILNSTHAFNSFIDITSGFDEFTLKIT